jgi:hypothetical protein
MIPVAAPSMHLRVAWIPVCREACELNSEYSSIGSLMVRSIVFARAMKAGPERSRSQRGPKNG